MPGIGSNVKVAAGMVVRTPDEQERTDEWTGRASFCVPYRVKQTTSVETSANPQPEPKQLMGVELKNPVSDRLREFAFRNRVLVGPNPEMVRKHTFLGQTLALCGAGPSLDPKHVRGTTHVWACNSALPWLIQQGVEVSAGVGIDQSPGLLREWSDPPDVTYYVATTCDPELVGHLIDHSRRVVFMHNYVAWSEYADDEFGHYNNDWPPAYMLGTGATVVPRVIGLAAWMGFERIDVHGADCALGDGDIAHANGETAVQAFTNPVLMGGEINGRNYRTRPDLLMAAVDLARAVQSNPGHVRLIGDTLAVALQAKPDAYLDEVVRRLKPGEIPTGA